MKKRTLAHELYHPTSNACPKNPQDHRLLRRLDNGFLKQGQSMIFKYHVALSPDLKNVGCKTVTLKPVTNIESKTMNYHKLTSEAGT
eukprot:4919405-Amphidinium_carterae.2